MPDLSLQGVGIAITRPLDQAEYLAQAITELGGTPEIFPLLAIMPLDDYSAFNQSVAEFADIDWAIFISSNAVEQAMPRLLSLFPNLPAKPRFAAIGPKTAKELAEFGVNKVLIPERQFDSEHLLSLPDLQDMSQQRVLIFRGLGGRELLAETLQQRGAEVTFAESYQRSNPQTDTQRLSQLWQNKRLHGIVVTSSEALRNLLDMTKHDQSDWLQQITVCVNHKRIAELALSRGLKVLVANAPGDDAMLECLKENLRP